MTRPGQGYIKNLGSPKLRNLARFLSCFGASIALAPQTFSALSNTFLFNARSVFLTVQRQDNGQRLKLIWGFVGDLRGA